MRDGGHAAMLLCEGHLQVTSETLKEVFGKVGKVASAVVMRDHFGASRGFGFVNYTKAEEADRAIQQYNKVPHRAGTWLVSTAPPPSLLGLE